MELAGWVGALNGGATIEQVTADIAGSPEYFQLHGSTNDAFLTALYFDALGRGGSVVEQASFLQELNSSTATRAQVAALVLSSMEYRIDLVQSFYQADLGRAADPAGLAGWVSLLQMGVTDQAVQAGILGSPEAFGNRS
jgi:hypothetical protein